MGNHGSHMCGAVPGGPARCGIVAASRGGTVGNVNIAVMPRGLAAECLAYSRCVKTDELAVDKVLIGWPGNRLLRRIAPSATGLTFGRPLSSLLLSTPVPQGEVSTVLFWATAAAPQRLEVPVGPSV
jgi:hypothetical protein